MNTKITINHDADQCYFSIIETRLQGFKIFWISFYFYIFHLILVQFLVVLSND